MNDARDLSQRPDPKLCPPAKRKIWSEANGDWMIFGLRRRAQLRILGLGKTATAVHASSAFDGGEEAWVEHVSPAREQRPIARGRPLPIERL